MERANQEIRDYALQNGVKLWQVAAAWPCGDSTLTRRMRREFSPKDKAKAMALIDKIKETNQIE